MTEFQTRIGAVYDAVRQSRGEFDLFALMEPEDAPGEWDLIMSAPWLADTMANSQFIADEANKVFSKADWDAVGHFMIFPKTYPAIAKLAADRRAQAEPPATLGNFDFADVPIRQAVIFRIPPAAKAKRRRRPAAAQR